MTRRNRRITEIHLCIVEEFEETEPATLPGASIETTADTADEPKPLAKTSAEYFPWARRAGGDR